MARSIVLALSLLIAACAAPAVAVPSPSATATRSVATTAPTAAATTAAPTPTPTPIMLPSNAAIVAPSGNVVWVLVGSSRLFRSTDRGNTWQERSLPAPPPVNVLISFVDDREGWVALPGSPGTQCQAQTVALWRTTDGAATWTRLAATGIADRMCKTRLTFTDSTHGYIAMIAPNERPVVYRTADGGNSWTASGQIPDPPGLSTTGVATQFQAGDMRQFGKVVLLDAFLNANGRVARYALRSSDDGATWSYVATAPNQTEPITFVTATRWLQLSSPGSSKETTDGGASWRGLATTYQQAAPVMPAVVFGDAQVGYATVRGTIQRTVDGGASWGAIKTPGTS